MVWDDGWGDGLPGNVEDWADGTWGDGLPLGPFPAVPPVPPGPTPPPVPAEWKVEILIDNEVVWSATTSKSKRLASFDVSRFTGRRNLKFRLTRTA